MPLQHDDLSIILAEVRHVRDLAGEMQQTLGMQVQETRELKRRVDDANGRTGKLEQFMVGHVREHDMKTAYQEGAEQMKARAVLTAGQLVKIAVASSGGLAATLAALHRIAG